ncbi:conserved hypothetical protein [Lausannevirus]|uniref:Uncharacterized protein n=2 Tax=Lausannevirus TaxID=999883 RepID=A0A0N9P796_9VIRU|nr:hypothetical protein LAU_0445 [Lausannevirus]AEA07295.1 conserved hypothetical protein [Lausannevirus]ALH07103.1 hypothetical protein PMV_405 [Port-miou virus]
MSLISEFTMDGDEFVGVAFKYTDGIVNMEFGGYRWGLEKTKKKFAELLKEVKEGKNCYLEFEGWNGQSVINVLNSKVTFSVAKHGGSGSGDMEFTLPLNKCIAAFENLS